MKHVPVIKQNIDGAEVNSVNTRDLHADLEVKTDYSKWIKRIIEKYNFVEDEDYVTIGKKDGRNLSTDFIVTLEVGKEICMISNTDKGRETRQYFISVEKKASREIANSLNNHIENMRSLFLAQEATGEMLTDHNRRIENLEKNTRIEAWQQKQLLDVKNRKVYELANGNDKLATKLHRNIWKHFKDRFHIPRYDALTQGKYNDGLTWLEALTIDMVV